MTIDRALLSKALPQYEVEGELGRGAWGVVLGGRHRQLNRRVAIKQLPRALSIEPDVRQRFQREAQVLASLEHSNIVTVYDYVEHDEICFIVMELLPGGSLSKRSQIRGLTLPVACAVALASSYGLRVAHARNILHRDIKPENLMFSSRGSIKITDFGLAKIVSGDQTIITQAGFVLGTPAYMAPEQALGQELTPATDVYALATVLYELIAGRLPYPSGDTLAVLHSHAYDPPAPLIEQVPGLPPVLCAVVMKGIANDPAERHLTAAEFGADLNEATSSMWGPTWRTSPETAEILGGESDSTGTTGDRSSAPRQINVLAESVDDAEPIDATMVVRRIPSVPTSELILAGEDNLASPPVAPDSNLRTTEVSPSQRDDTETFSSPPGPPPRPKWRRKRFLGAGLGLLLVAAAAISVVLWLHTGATNFGAVLPSAGVLKPGQEMTSPNHSYSLLMQSDGNLVEYGAKGPVWATGTSGHDGAYALLQPSGNLVIYPRGKGPPCPECRTTSALWASSTQPKFFGVYMRLDDSGRITLVVPQSNDIAWKAGP